MSKRTTATCSDCYFRRAGLCALPGEEICPTFRTRAVGRLTPPPQPRLVPRTPAAIAANAVA
jgi:hypothetical protein